MRWNHYKLRHLSLLQSAMDSYYKLRQLFLQRATRFITSCHRYYKVWWIYYKLRQVLQSAMIITNCDSTAAHFFCKFLCRCFPWLQRETSRNLFMEEMSYASSFTFFFTAAHSVSLHWWPLAFLILSLPLQNFHVVLPTKISPLFFLSHSRSLSPFFSLRFTGLPPTLSFSRSMFQICGHDNQSKLNTLDNMDTETISAFRFRLYWLFSCLCFTRRRWLCDFPPK